jgi:hypothetical protein
MIDDVENYIDELIKSYLVLDHRDIVDAMGHENYTKNRLKIKEALNKYDWIIDTEDGGRTKKWFLKKLTIKKCSVCGQEFKTPSRGIMFCCDECKNKFNEEFN